MKTYLTFQKNTKMKTCLKFKKNTKMKNHLKMYKEYQKENENWFKLVGTGLEQDQTGFFMFQSMMKFNYCTTW